MGKSSLYFPIVFQKVNVLGVASSTRSSHATNQPNQPGSFGTHHKAHAGREEKFDSCARIITRSQSRNG